MKNARNLLLAAGLLAVPASGPAQEPASFSIGIGLAARTHPDSWSGIAAGLAHRPRSEGAFPGPGGFAPRSSAQGRLDDYHGHGHHHGWSTHDCWDFLWHEPWCGCNRYVLFGYASFGWWDFHLAWWRLGFLGWPSPRQVRHHWWGYGPFRYGAWDWYPRHRGTDRHYRHRYPRHGHDGGGYVTPRGYRSGGKAKPRGRSGDRIVRGSPIFGPSYKEDPRAHATRDGPRRTASRAAPRGSRGEVADGGGRSRPGERPKTRRARPRGETKPATTGSSPSKPRTRRATSPGARAQPSAPAPRVRSRAGSRPAPAARKIPTRRTTPATRPATSERPAPAAGKTPVRRPAPKARPAPNRRPAPKARPAPARRPAPKARPAPRRSGSSKKQPARRGGRN